MGFPSQKISAQALRLAGRVERCERTARKRPIGPVSKFQPTMVALVDEVPIETAFYGFRQGEVSAS